MNVPEKGVSVLICTYNGARNLPATLQYLAAQQVPVGMKWEVILVDNASTDNSRLVATQEWSRHQTEIPLHVLEEKQPGKDKAVDLGLRHARYGYVIICDDDNWLAEKYVQEAFEIMEANPRIGLLGGRGIPVTEGSLPDWLSYCKKYFAIGRQSNRSGEIKPDPFLMRFVWGAGSVINMKAYRLLVEAGFERIITHERYPSLARSEDVEMSLALHLTGYSLWYEERLTFQHYISRDKLKWKSFIKLTKPAALIRPYLSPYQYLILMGGVKVSLENSKAPYRWYFRQRVQTFLNNHKTWDDFKTAVRVFLGMRQEGNFFAHIKLRMYYEFVSLFLIYPRYENIYRQVAILKNNLVEARSKQPENFWAPSDEEDACHVILTKSVDADRSAL